MNRFYKSATNHKYYQYLDKYSPAHIRKYQSNEHYYLGRRGAWKNLVYKYQGDHYNLEEEHNFKYKSHLIFTWLSYRAAWALFAYGVIYTVFFLGDMTRAFNFADVEHAIEGHNDLEGPSRYESLYLVSRAQKY